MGGWFTYLGDCGEALVGGKARRLEGDPLVEFGGPHVEMHLWWVGGWVGWWLAYRKVEENEAIRMSYCKLGMGGWVDGSGGWVGGRDLP